MEYRKLGSSSLEVSAICLGTWAFGGGKWWGKQEDKDSVETLDFAISEGLTAIDTAPVYGWGRSERVIGAFIKKKKIREKVVLATKLGLSRQGPQILPNLKKQRMVQELDESRQRLQTDYFDLYQVHWPDPDTPIGETAEVMHGFYQKGFIKAVGVSNYSVEQMQEFMKYCPLHSCQPQYSMFVRNIEDDIVPFCLDKKIAVITYAPLYSGILTGKFFFGGAKIPDDINRKMKKKDFEEPRFSINKKALIKLRKIASSYGRSLAQLVINWNFNQSGVISAIVGSRSVSQLEDNLGGVGWKISEEDLKTIEDILDERLEKISKCAELLRSDLNKHGGAVEV